MVFFELTVSCLIRWLIRLALVYALVRFVASKNRTPIKAQAEVREAENNARNSFRDAHASEKLLPDASAARGSLRKRGSANEANVIEQMSKPRQQWEVNKESAVTVAKPVSPKPVEQERKLKSQPVPKPKPKSERDKREENLQILRFHSRPVTWICFNKEGNMLFSCGKDTVVVAWRYEKMDECWIKHAEFTSHSGAVWACSISEDASLLCSCGADNKVCVWDVKQMELSATLEVKGVVKFCEWRRNKIKDSPPTLAFCQNKFGKNEARIVVAEFCDKELKVLYAIAPESNAVQVRWTDDELLISAHEHGKVAFWRMAEKLFEVDHDGVKLSKIHLHGDLLGCALASGELRIWTFTSTSAEPLVSVTTDRPLNDVHFDADNFLVGGGQDARDVALQASTVEKQFTPLLFAGSAKGLVPQLEGKFKNHFGPIHCVAFTERYIASGGEDGLIHMETIG